MITRAIGIGENVRPDVTEMLWHHGDILVLSSDGMTDKVEPETILELSRQHPPRELCQALVDLANDRGGDDNITVIILQLAAAEEAASPETEALQLVTTDEAPSPETEALQLVTTDEAPSPETEARVSLPVDIDTDDASYGAVIHDIDGEGVFIETGEPFAPGTEIYITIAEPGDDQPFMLTGTVVRRDAKGIDVRFEDLDADSRRLIEALQARLRGQR
jgi:hypothetical protein